MFVLIRQKVVVYYLLICSVLNQILNLHDNFFFVIYCSRKRVYQEFQLEQWVFEKLTEVWFNQYASSPPSRCLLLLLSLILYHFSLSQFQFFLVFYQFKSQSIHVANQLLFHLLNLFIFIFHHLQHVILCLNMVHLIHSRRHIGLKVVNIF